MRFDIGAASDIGRRKKKNEDSLGVFGEDAPGLKLFDEGALFVVADGLGGHIGGEIASKLAVSVFKDLLKAERPEESQPETPETCDQALHALLCRHVELANTSIFQANQDHVKNGKPMGTTMCAALVEAKKAHVVNVGDSRAYHIRDGAVIARTEDHSWLDEQVKQGRMTKEEAEKDRRKNLVTRCLGTHAEMQPDIYAWHIVPGDRLLICTDGLINMVSDADLLEQINAGGTAQDVVERLVDLANENGGRDNITVILAEVSPRRADLIKRRASALLAQHGAAMARGLLLIVFAAVCFASGMATGFSLRPIVDDGAVFGPLAGVLDHLQSLLPEGW